MTQGSVSHHLVRLTVPMFLGISSMMVASLFDAVYVGWIGTEELAAISFTFPVVMGLTSVVMGLGIGASSIIARLAGANEQPAIRELTTHTMILVTLAVAVLSVLGYVFCEPMFRMLGAEGELLALVVRYMSVWFFGFPLFALPMVAGNIFRSVGRPRVTGVIMTSGAGIQVALAPLLMFGFPGLTAGMGFIGSAWAFVGSRLVTLLLTVWVITAGLRLLTRANMTPGEILRSWTQIFRIGVPSMLSNLIGPVSLGIIISLLAKHGDAVLASFGIASRIEMLATMILMALSSSVGPFVGQNFAGRRFDRIDDALGLSYRFSFAWGAFAFVVLATTGRWLVAGINDDAAVIEATYLYLLIVPLSYGVFGASMAAGSAFIALGRPLPTLVMSVLRMFGLYVPAAVVANEIWGYVGVYAATAFANVVIGSVAMVWIRRELIAQQVRRQPADMVSANAADIPP